MKKLLLIAALLSLGGCTTVRDYCESTPEHGRVCVVTGEVVAVVVVTSVALSVTHHSQAQVHNCDPATDKTCGH